jgi:hypothetical protein
MEHHDDGPDPSQSQRQSPKPLGRYAHVLVGLADDAGEPFEELMAAVTAGPGCNSWGCGIPPLDDPEAVAEGWVEVLVDAHDIDVEGDDFAEYYVLRAAIERFISGPRRPPDD